MPYLQANGIQISYEEQGEGDPLLLIMGIGAPGSVWAKHAEYWSRRFRCILPDNRGVGRTDKPPGPYDSAMMADDCAGLLAALDIGAVRVIGCSMGSIIAQQLAVRHARLVRAMVLMCPWAWCDRYAQALFAHLSVLKARLRPEEFAMFIQLLIFSKGTWDDNSGHADLIKARHEAAIGADPQPLYALEAQAAACSFHDARAALRGVQCPTLVIGGEADIFTPSWMAREVAEAVPGAELHLYPRAGHAFHWECLDDFNPRVLNWLLQH